LHELQMLFDGLNRLQVTTIEVRGSLSGRNILPVFPSLNKLIYGLLTAFTALLLSLCPLLERSILTDCRDGAI
jgi:hypothetical protein